MHHNQLYAAVTFGVIIGAGVGIVLRSIGSNGGLNIAGVILHQGFNTGLGMSEVPVERVFDKFYLLPQNQRMYCLSSIGMFRRSVHRLRGLTACSVHGWLRLGVSSIRLSP